MAPRTYCPRTQCTNANAPDAAPVPRRPAPPMRPMHLRTPTSHPLLIPPLRHQLRPFQPLQFPLTHGPLGFLLVDCTPAVAHASVGVMETCSTPPLGALLDDRLWLNQQDGITKTSDHAEVQVIDAAVVGMDIQLSNLKLASFISTTPGTKTQIYTNQHPHMHILAVVTSDNTYTATPRTLSGHGPSVMPV